MMIRQRLILLFSFCFFLHTGLLYAAKGETAGFVLPQYSQRISLDFKGADLKDVLKVFSKQIGANFIFDKDVQMGTTTVFLDNVPVEEALMQVLESNGLTYEYNEGMNLFVIKTKKEDEETLVTRMYPLNYASVDSSKMKLTGGTSSGAIGASLKSVLSSKGKVVDDARTNSLIVSDLEKNFPEIERMIARLDVPLKQVLIEVEMLDVSKSTSDTLGARFNLVGSFKTGTMTTPFPFNNLANKNETDGRTFEPATLTLSEAGVVLSFLKSKTDTISLARPRITTNENETATIQIATDEAIGIKTTTATDTTSPGQEVERYQTGVFLTVTPQVNRLTNEISLAIEPRVIDASIEKTFNGIDYKNPEERSVKVMLRVPNGQSVVIGGLLRRTKSDGRTSVPFLGSLPLIGAAFRSSEKENNDRELMVFLTPYVLESSQPLPQELKTEINKQLQLREQTTSDLRSGAVNRELDMLNRFNKER
ncbi:MAG: hypothetical protein HQL20_02285 [Candidatus Omnitrophica bacterium]|nr:hypothetical protein [Candidatus Omnitrophota bacterium]